MVTEECSQLSKFDKRLPEDVWAISILLITDIFQETVVSRVEATRKKDDMIRKLRSMIDIYNPPKPKPLRKNPASPEKILPSPEKVSFNNTAFIDIVPVVKAQSAKTVNVPDLGDLKQADMKTETEETVEADHIVIDTIYAPDEADTDTDDEYQDTGPENDEDDPGEEQEEEARVVKLEPRVSKIHLNRFLKDLTFKDEKTLASDRLKDIKHKTKCRVCQEEFQNRQVYDKRRRKSVHTAMPARHSWSTRRSPATTTSSAAGTVARASGRRYR